MDPQTLELIKTIGTPVVTVVATVATLKADIRWIKRWLVGHAEEDKQNFDDVRDRLGRVEERLMSQK